MTGRFPDVIIQAKPGVYRMDSASYHKDPCLAPSLSSGTARTLLAQSPMHAWTAHPRLNPNYEAEEKESFDLGAAAHALLLEGEDRMVVLPYDDYRKKEAKEARDYARFEGKHPILEAKYPAVRAMREVALQKIAACTDLSGLTLADGKAEETIIWEEDGAWCRARPDWMSTERDVILDYKTTAASAEPDAWTRTMVGLGGDIQGAFYLRGNAATGGMPSDDAKFIFIVQEIEPPYACSLIGLSPPFVALGTGRVREAIDTWRQCMKTNRWPAYPNRICWVEPPAWHMAKFMEREVAESLGTAYDIEKLWGPPKAQPAGDLVS